MNEIQEMTAGNSRLVLNICFAYNSSQELERCAEKIRDQARLISLHQQNTQREFTKIANKKGINYFWYFVNRS